MSYNVSIPGKLYIAGEYAVVKGFHAIIIPTQLNVHVKISASNIFSIISNQWKTQNTYQLNYLKKSKALWKRALYSAYLYLNYKNIDIKKNHIEINSELDKLDHKLGIGSSGAIVIGIIHSILIFHGVKVTPLLLYKLGVIALKDLHERSSFGDLACSAFNQAIVYKKDMHIFYQQSFEDIFESSWENLVITPIDLSLKFMVIHTNESASSTNLVERLNVNMTESEQLKHFKRMDKMVLSLIDSVNQHDYDHAHQSIQSIESLMTLLDAYMDGKMYASPIKEIFEFAKKLNLTYKISGAGGGDNVLLFYKEQKEYTKIKQLLPKGFLDITPYITGGLHE